MSATAVTEKRFDAFAAAAFWLAMATMVFPVEADILFGLLRTKALLMASLTASCFFAAVFIPFLISCRRHWRQSKQWRGQTYLGTTTLILTMNVLMFSVAICRGVAQ